MNPIDLIREGKVQRYFRATRKLCVPGIISHITQRAAGKEPLFLEDSDYLFMLGRLKEISMNYSLEMYAFCLMPNHVHLLLSPREDNLSDAMRDLFSGYAMNFNRKYERKGHLFGGPYRQAVCYDDRYFLAASLYIHLNPIQASLVADPVKYRWSSIKLYATENPPKSFVNPNFVLGLLSDRTHDRIKRYRELLDQGSEIKTGHVFEQEDSIERFGAKLAALFPALFKSVERKKKVAQFSGSDLLGFETLEKKIQEIKQDYATNFPENRKAKKHLIEQLLARGYTRTEIAGRLGISRKTVYNLLRASL